MTRTPRSSGSDRLDRRRLLAEHWLLRCLSEPELDRLLSYARVQMVPRHRVIFEEGEEGRELMAILAGSAKIAAQAPGGRSVVLDILGPGEVFGEMALIDDGPRSASVTALQDSSLLVIDKRDFQPLLDANPSLANSLLRTVCGRLRRASDQVVEAMYLERGPRLAKTLLWLAERYGKPGPDGIEIGVSLSQQELGDVAAMSRESVNRQLTEWRTEDLLTQVRKTLILHNKSELERLSQLSVDARTPGKQGR